MTSGPAGTDELDYARWLEQARADAAGARDENLLDAASAW